MGSASASTAFLNGDQSIRQRHDKTSSEGPDGLISTLAGSDAASGPTGYDEIEVPLGKPMVGLRKRRAKGKGKVNSKNVGWMATRKGWVEEGFRRFGEHCARNQIRTLLIDCLVMTNLFYPSLALYLQRKFPPLHPPSPPSHNIHRIPLHKQSGRRRVQKEHPLSLLSTPVLDSFFPYPPPLLPRLGWAGWWGRDTGQQSRPNSSGSSGGGGLEHEGKRQEWSTTRVKVGRNAEEGVGESEDEIRFMRIGWADVGHVLDRDREPETSREWEKGDDLLLRTIWDLAEDWERLYSSSGERCIRQLGSTSDLGDQVDPVGPCYLISADGKSHLHGAADHDAGQDDIPLVDLSSLANSAIASMSSSSTTKTMSSTEDASTVPIGWNPHAGNVYHSLAVLFQVPRANSSSFEARWLEAMAVVAGRFDGEVFVEPQGSRLGAGDQTGEWLLTHNSMSTLASTLENSVPVISKSDPTSSSAVPPNAVLLLYFILVGILLAQLSNATKVHSRFGLAFTGVVQLICSAVMSFSVVALLGWNGWGSSQDETTLPSYVLPFVIVVVGVENMSTLTKAVFSVPFDYSVPVRIGLGLSRAGITIALTSFTDVIVLGIVWLFVNIRPVREFCVFACVVIITDWFMLHTFFLAVLSIDAQRLELADVLTPPASGPAAAKQVPTKSQEEIEKNSTGFSWRDILRARTAKSGSLILLLLSVGILYYYTESSRSPHESIARLYGYTPTTVTTIMSVPTSSPTPFSTTIESLASLTPPERFWRSLNPRGWPFIRIVIPAASIIVLPRLGHQMRPKDIRKLAIPTSRLLLPRLKPLFYLFKVVVLPQAVTAGALYILLLYLLKDSELLDAQRNKDGRGDGPEESDRSNGQSNGSKSINAIVQAYMLPCSHESDIDLISSSDDGKVVLSVGLDNTICLWRFQDGQSGSGTREPVNSLLPHGDIISTACVRSDGEWLAVGTTGGLVQLWAIHDDGELESLPLRKLDREDSGISNLTFDHGDLAVDPFMSRSSSSDGESSPTLLVGFANGAVYSSKPTEFVQIIAARDGTSARTQFGLSSGKTLIVISADDGTYLWTRRSSKWISTLLPLRSRSDRVTAMSHSYMSVRGVKMRLVALGYKSGHVEVFDQTGHMVAQVGQPGPAVGAITAVEIAPTDITRCSTCGSTSADGCFVISSTKTHVYVDRVQPHLTSFCRCSGSSGRRGSVVEDPSLKLGIMGLPSASIITSAKASPARSPTLVIPPTPGRAFSPGISPKRSPSLLPPQSNGEFPLSSHGVRRLTSSSGSRDENEGSHFKGPVSPSPMGQNSGLSAPKAYRSSSDGSSSSGGDISTRGRVQDNEDEILASGVEMEMDVIPLGAVVSQSGGWAYLSTSGGRIVGVRRIGMGVDDSQWQIWSLDLSLAWNGTTLIVDCQSLNRTLDQTRRMSIAIKTSDHLSSSSTSPSSTKKAVPTPTTSLNEPDKGVSMKDRRAERLLSLKGRAPFPSSIGSFTVPIHPTLAYISIHPTIRRGRNSVVAGFGNRLGVLSIVPQNSTGHAALAATGMAAKAGINGFALSPANKGYINTPPPPQGSRRLQAEGLDSAKKVN